MSIAFIPQADKYWAFRGGLDQVSPALEIKPGNVRFASNMEIGINGGLKPTQGYERYDGRTRPSDAAYSILNATMTASYSVGDTLTGATSGATGVIIAAVEDEYFVLTKVVGTFQSGETLNISGNPVATSTSVAASNAASTPALNATYRNLAADQYRADIAAPTGSGSIRGVWMYNGDVYCIRDNAGGTAAVLYKDSTSGWTSVNLGRELAFTSGGTTAIAVGDTITGATSGATAVIGGVVLTSGTWEAGTAAGYFYFASQTGTFQAENLNVGASLNLATIAANSTAVTLAPGGHYEFVNHNFGGAAGADKMYGAGGVDKAFEYDGTTFIKITTGMAVDTPTHVDAFKGHLFLSFDGSLQHSAIGNPYSWSPVLGAAELSAGDRITGTKVMAGGATDGAMAVFTRNTTKVLYGNSSADWNLQNFNPDAGAREWSVQYIGQAIYLDDRGLTSMAAAQEFGNFAENDLSRLVKPYINALRDTVIGSCVVRDKNQYRLFFSGGAALYVTFIGKKVAGMMPVSLTDPVTCICSQETAAGVEEIYFGSTDGMVYQMERGTSHDGDDIAWSAQLAYNHFGSPRQLKRYMKAVIEVSGESYFEFSMGYTLGYGRTEIPQGPTETLTTALSASQWDSFTWDQFFWDGQTLMPSEMDLDGSAENISLALSGSSDKFEPALFNGVIVRYSPQRMLR